ncbi:MAG: peptidylprolyl isomerase [Turicibacter sp.]|nr:peptidylprolyl isomerase [Turicibacter sp.]
MSKVLAKVKDFEITELMLDETIETLRAQQNINITDAEDKANLLEELIMRQLVVEDALESGIADHADFQKVYRDVLFQYSISQLFKNLHVSDEEAQAYYEANKGQFAEPTVRASHILVDSEEKANELKAAINDGASFEELAKAESSCPSSERGGDLGEFGRGQMVPEFEQAAFDMEPGQVSDVVSTQFGHHLIKLVDRNDTVPFDGVKEQITNYLKSTKQNELYAKFTAGLKDKYSVEK